MRIVTEPDKRLHLASADVVDINDEVRALLNGMCDLMYKAQGMGLAAVQVGVMRKAIVVDTDQLIGKSSRHNVTQLQHGGKPLLMVNPRVVEKSAETATYTEACLSYPGISVEVTRPISVIVEYLDYDGNEQRLETDSILAVCLQHEIDHLYGKVITDYVSSFKRELLHKKVAKFLREHESTIEDEKSKIMSA